MTFKFTVKNSIIHVLIHGYFQRAYQVWYVSQKGIENYSATDLLVQKRLFDSLQSNIRGTNTYSIPHMMNAIQLLKGEKNYPKEITILDNEKIFFEKIIKLPYKTLVYRYRKYCKIHHIKPVNNPFDELISALRTPEAIDFLMKQFIEDYQNQTYPEMLKGS